MKKGFLSIVTFIAINNTVIAGGDITPVETTLTLTEGHWNGFYLGGQTGYQWGKSDLLTSETWGGISDLYPTNGLDTLGFTGGLYGGYNWLFENDFLLGIEGAWNYTTANGDQRIGNALPEWTHAVEQDWEASVLLRAGKVIDDYMPFITGGATWTKLNLKTFNPLWGISFDDSDTTFSGWSIGAGLEMILSENYHARIQYLYTNYGSEQMAITQNIDPSISYTSDVDYTNQTLTIGISYQF
jgi:outer membrane immunogenic protein